jgi:lipopolysaccharide export system permease protein
MWKKLVYPLAALVMMALALPFAYLQDRMGAVSVKVFAGIMLGITFHMLNGLFSNLGAINSWPPFVLGHDAERDIPAGGGRHVVVGRERR